MLLLLLLIQCKISMYWGPVRPVRCFVTPVHRIWIFPVIDVTYNLIVSVGHTDMRHTKDSLILHDMWVTLVPFMHLKSVSILRCGWY